MDLPCLADAEIVLEGEILPTGWTLPEGRFGEFTRLMGGLHWNPVVRVKAVTTAPRRHLLRAAHAVGEHLARGAHALRRDPARAAAPRACR
jgi:UbiD family decarboxylase